MTDNPMLTGRARLYRNEGPTGRLIHEMADALERLAAERLILARRLDDYAKHSMSREDFDESFRIVRRVVAESRDSEALSP